MNTKQAPLPPNGTRTDLNKVVDPHTTAWQLEDSGNVVSLLADGWVVTDVYFYALGFWSASPPKQEIPTHIMAKLPQHIADAITARLADGRKLVIR